MISYGIVGLPNVGKSALFNVLTSANAPSANFPFCTIEPNKGAVAYTDHRVDRLAIIYGAARTRYSGVEVVDIAGLVKGASEGAGMGNEFIAHIQRTDVILHIVACFSDDTIISTSTGSPYGDIMTINEELILKDLQIVTAQLKKRGGPEQQTVALQKAHDTLLSCQLLSVLPQDVLEILRPYNLVTAKPMILVANCDNVTPASFHQASEELQLPSISINAKKLDTVTLLDLCLKSAGMISYFTAGPKEARNWLIKDGANAREAAGVIHSDFTQRFIRGQIYTYKAIDECGCPNIVRKKGLVRTEGSSYVMQDGDVAIWLVK